MCNTIQYICVIQYNMAHTIQNDTIRTYLPTGGVLDVLLGCITRYNQLPSCA